MPGVGPFDLNIRHLTAIREVMAQGAIGAAAGAMGLSQPALTVAVRKLEAQFGCTLFDRVHDGVRPTDACRHLVGRIEAALSHLRWALPRLKNPERLVTAAQMRALLALADHGSFAEAARLTGSSEGALHRAVRALELGVGKPLAIRRGRGIALTLEGRQLARASRLVVRELAAAIAELGPTEARDASIVIGAMPLCRAQLLPRALNQLMATWPNVHVRIVEGSWTELVDPLRDGVLDLMIGALRDKPAPPDLSQHALFEDRLVVVAGPHHPLCAVARPSLDQLGAYGWIVGPAGSPLRQQWENLFAGQPTPMAPIECGSVMTIRELLRASDLLTLLSPAQVAVELESAALALIGPPITGAVRTIGVAMRMGWQPTPVQLAFLAALAEAASDMRL